jgi:deazaflavin-dependent oxidoreductase (nitroreductase family)
MNIEERATPNPVGWVERDIQSYLASGGQDNTHPAGDDLILLYTTGRTTGEIRRVALRSYPGPGDERLVLAGGNQNEPAWYRNLLADIKVWVRKQSDFYEAEASVLPPQERQRFWSEISARRPEINQHQKRVGRVIPVVRLTRNRSLASST